jgi:methionine-rich copper-binding protein CopC
MLKTLSQLTATAVLILGLSLLAPGRAESSSTMHLHLTRSQPAKDTLLASAPTEIALWFSATPNARLSRITLTGPGGAVKLGPVTTSPDDSLRLSVAVESELGSGDYTVTWRTASADGHPVTGKVPFGVRPE